MSTTAPDTRAPRPFGIRDKIGYAFGDVANDFTFILASMFLLKFYTDVMGVSSAVVGVIMMAVRLADAVIDVGVGRMVDLSQPGRGGKFRPWILRGSLFVAAISALMYPVWFQGMSEGFKIAWLAVSYFLWSAMYSVVNIPYGSMASAITTDSGQRTQLSVFRNAGATIASLALSVSIPMLVYYTDAAGNTVMSGSVFSGIAAVASVLAFVSYLVCYAGTTERVAIPKSEPKEGGLGFVKGLVRNRPFVAYCGFTVFVILGQFTISAMSSYVYPNYYGAPAVQSVASLMGSLIILAFSVVATPLARRFGKKEVAGVGLVVAAATLLACWAVRPSDPWVYCGMYLVASLGMGTTSTYLFAIVVDVIDYDEVHSGTREDGTIYSSYSFFRKLAQSLSSGLSGLLLGLIGYTEATAFDPAVLDGIFSVACLVPAACFAVAALIIIAVYPLTRDQVARNGAILAERKRGARP